MATLIGISRAAKSGLLFKEASLLETMAKSDLLALDKTGTITEGKPSVIEFKAFADFDPAVLNNAISMLARASGVFGMVGGQTADILMEGKPVDADTLRFIHRRKTGALLRVSVELGGYLGGGSDREVTSLAQYGTSVGLAFQVVDDLLDIEGDEALTGKPVGSDERNAKATYPALYGLERTKEMANELLQESLDALKIFGSEADPLRAIANYVVNRKR
jgi:geranylgeranyl diphosphate synthase type II